MFPNINKLNKIKKNELMWMLDHVYPIIIGDFWIIAQNKSSLLIN